MPSEVPLAAAAPPVDPQLVHRDGGEAVMYVQRHRGQSSLSLVDEVEFLVRQALGRRTAHLGDAAIGYGGRAVRWFSERCLDALLDELLVLLRARFSSLPLADKAYRLARRKLDLPEDERVTLKGIDEKTYDDLSDATRGDVLAAASEVVDRMRIRIARGELRLELTADESDAVAVVLRDAVTQRLTTPPDASLTRTRHEVVRVEAADR